MSNSGQVKSSVQRAIRAKVLEQYPKLEAVIDDIIPKKGSIVLVKWCVRAWEIGCGCQASTPPLLSLSTPPPPF